MKNRHAYLINFYVVGCISLGAMLACHSPRTPDFSQTENEGSNPDANRTSDSTKYDPVTEPGAEGTNDRQTDSSQIADDSMSGGRR
jgi:hypothetical protein